MLPKYEVPECDKDLLEFGHVIDETRHVHYFKRACLVCGVNIKDIKSAKCARCSFREYERQRHERVEEWKQGLFSNQYMQTFWLRMCTGKTKSRKKIKNVEFVECDINVLYVKFLNHCNSNIHDRCVVNYNLFRNLGSLLCLYNFRTNPIKAFKINPVTKPPASWRTYSR